jgi:hypothetical protein
MNRALYAFAGLVLAASGVFAAGFDKPYAIVEKGDASETRREDGAAITQVDGVSTRDSRRTDPIEPGKHKLTIRYDTARVTLSPEKARKEVDLDLQPCTLYRVVAQRRNNTGLDWDPHFYSEPIGECQKKFGVAKK